jgi:serine/threonine kinase 16
VSLQGGFSYVYLVQDTSNEALYALKKIRCPFGEESVTQAMKEVEAYALFSPHPNIIHSVDYCIQKDKSDPGAKTVYILLPYYRRGNLQDIINANLVNHTKFPERRLMVLFLGVCRALKAMHYYKVKGEPGVDSQNNAKQIRREAAAEDEEQQEPLMEGEVTMSQEGVAPGDIRAYAHRDIKPGKQAKAFSLGRC